VVAPDDAGEALAQRHALHIDALAGLEDRADVELRARLEVRELLGLRAELAQRMTRLDARLGEVAGERLRNARSPGACRTPPARRRSRRSRRS